MRISVDDGSRNVRKIILQRIPYTLLLMGTYNLILFFSTLFIALALSRQYGSFWDKFVVALSPTSSVPPGFLNFLNSFIRRCIKDTALRGRDRCAGP